MDTRPHQEARTSGGARWVWMIMASGYISKMYLMNIISFIFQNGIHYKFYYYYYLLLKKGDTHGTFKEPGIRDFARSRPWCCKNCKNNLWNAYVVLMLALDNNHERNDGMSKISVRKKKSNGEGRNEEFEVILQAAVQERH